MFKRWIIRYAAVISALLLAGSILAAATPNTQTTNAACPNFRTRLNGVTLARVTPGTPNNLRSTPGGERIGQIPGGSTFEVLSGPRCLDGYTWWEVSFNGLVGWTAEGTGSDYYVEPLQSPAPQPDSAGGIGGGGASRAARLLPSDMAQGIVFNPAGGGGSSAPQETLCLAEPVTESGNFVNRAAFDGYEIAAYAWDVFDEETFRLLPLLSGEQISVEYVPTQVNALIDGFEAFAYSDHLFPTYGICSASPINPADAVAVSPDGELFPAAVLPDREEQLIRLPLQAYTQPGMWTLAYRDFELLIDVPAPSEPASVSAVAGYSLLTGYPPNMDIYLLFVEQDALFDAVRVTTDANGNAIIALPNEKLYSGWIVETFELSRATFESTVTRADGSSFIIPYPQNLRVYHDYFFNNGSSVLADWTCPGALPVRLSNDSIAVVSREVQLYNQPDRQFSASTWLVPGDILEVDGVVACSEDGTWWHVYATDYQAWGFVHESMGGQYYLEPAN